MSLNIKTADGLKEIGKVTKEKVVNALGYEPADKKVETSIKDNTDKIGEVEASLAAHEADTVAHVTAAEKQTWSNKSDVKSYNDLQDAPNIAETDTDDLVITDESGNIIAKVDKDGLATTGVNAKTIKLAGEDLGAKLASLDADLEASKIPSINDDGSGKLEFADEAGNVVARIDEDGFETTKVTAKEAIIGGVDINEHISDKQAHLQVGELEGLDARLTSIEADLADYPITQDGSDKLTVADEAGNIVFEINSDGQGATNVHSLLINGKPLTEFISETSAKVDVLTDAEIIALVAEGMAS